MILNEKTTALLISRLSARNIIVKVIRRGDRAAGNDHGLVAMSNRGKRGLAELFDLLDAVGIINSDP
jgi:hypothetical protein